MHVAMRGLLNHIRAFWKRPASPPRVFSHSGSTLIDSTVEVEEETLPHYGRTSFYPVRLGEVLQDRYQIVNKLGYGANSTAWLCRDLLEHAYIAMKLCTPSSVLHKEVEILEHLRELRSTHAGRHLVRTFKDEFSIKGPSGYTHQCLVMEPMIASLADVLPYIPNDRLPESLMRLLLHDVLLALAFLHSEAGVVHTDLQPGNLMFNSRDPVGLFTAWETLELQEPSPRKDKDLEGTVYKSRPFDLSRDMKSMGQCVITDLGNARMGNSHIGLIQPDIYRAPEVVLDMSWGPATDIWNLGVMVWDIFRGDHVHLFHPTGQDRERQNARVLAEMTSLLGPPPMDFLSRSESSLTYWTPDGKWKGLAEIKSDYTFEKLEIWLKDDSQKHFLRFMRKMLAWKPEDRWSAAKLLQDEWLNARNDSA